MSPSPRPPRAAGGPTTAESPGAHATANDSGIWPNGVLSAAGYFAAGTLLTVTGFNGGDLFPPVLDAPEYAWFGILLLGCAGLLFRRSNVPLMLAVTGTAAAASLLMGGGIITYLLGFELFYSGILFGSPKLSRAVERACLVAAALLVAASSVVYRDWAQVLFGLLQAVIVCLIPLWWAGTLRRQTDVAEQERLRADAERLNAEHAAEVAELYLQVALASERAAMARELHDAVAGRLSAVALQSAAALAAADAGLDRRVLAQVRSESVQALNEMRAMIDLLESGAGTPSPETGTAADPGTGVLPVRDSMAGGLDQLQTLTESARLAGNPVRLRIDAEPGGLPVLVQSSIFRIVQESLTNAVKHAPGQPVQVLVRHTSDEVLLTVSNPLDAGTGRRNRDGGVDSSSGSGLRNMAFRTAQLSGTFSAGPAGGETPGGETGAGDDTGDGNSNGSDVWQVQVCLPVEGKQ